MPVIPFIPAIIGGVASIAGAKVAAGGATDAAKTQAGATDKALDLQKQMYEQQRSDLGPYRSAGQGAVGQLAYGLGVPGFESGPQSHAAADVPLSPLMTAAAPGAANQATLPGGPTIHTAFPDLARQINAANPAVAAGQQAGQQMAGGMVKVQAPNGQVGMVPQANLQAALAAGGKQVS